MCGFLAAFTHAPLPEKATRLGLDRLRRRGPDAEGQWREQGVYLGHRRLAIIDLDERAAQPMVSACGRYVIAFNGEIYNFAALRGRLESEGVVFHTRSDTEVILALFAREGEALLEQLHGMFAFVIWDRVARRAFAARDPYGIKPLYVATTAEGVLLASQVKALMATQLVSRDPDPKGQAGFWMLGSVPEPHTWYRDVRAVPAGHCLWIENARVTASRSWFDTGRVWREAPASADLPDEEIAQRVRLALRESVSRHLVADVPVGVFLSGGIDSGALAGLMSELGGGGVQGITIAFDEFAGRAEDEAPVAAAIARHYGIAHHVCRVTKQEFLDDLPRVLDAMDQPSIDGINTWYATKAVAERGLKVVVSGVGGDELFQGYESFAQLPRLVSRWGALAKLPGAMPLARAAANLQAARTGNNRWRHAPAWVRSIGGAWWLRRSVFAPEDLPALMGAELAGEALAGFFVEGWLADMAGPWSSETRLALAQIESATYLRNQLLRDSDWASMDHGVELRTPLVDAHLLQHLQPYLPAFHRFPKKALLAGAPKPSLPREVLERRKTGFGIPVQRWVAEGSDHNPVRGTWKGWMQELVGAYR